MHFKRPWSHCSVPGKANTTGVEQGASHSWGDLRQLCWSRIIIIPTEPRFWRGTGSWAGTAKEHHEPLGHYLSQVCGGDCDIVRSHMPADQAANPSDSE